MSSQKPKSLYPEVIESTTSYQYSSSTSTSSAPPIYPVIDPNDLATDNLLTVTDDVRDLSLNLHPQPQQEQLPQPVEELIIKVPGAIVHLIDKQKSVELASGEFDLIRLRQGENVIAVLARVGDEIQWPLAKDEAVVKLDESHYFFTLRVPCGGEDDCGSSGDAANESDDVLSYGLTIASKGQKKLLKKFDKVLEMYSSFSVREVGNLGVLDGSVAIETSPEELGSEKKMELVASNSAAYWTTLAPNVEDYSGTFARFVAMGSGHLVRGVLWCGDVTVDRLNWGHAFLKKRIKSGPDSEISPYLRKRMRRTKKLTKRADKVTTAVLSGVVKVSGFFTGSLVNSKAGQKLFSFLPGEVVLASLDGFNKVCDAAEVSGRNILSTTSYVTTDVVTQKYGEQAGSFTNDGFEAAGHAFGTALAVYKLRKAFNPKSVMKPTTIAKAVSEANSSETMSRIEDSSEKKSKKKDSSEIKSRIEGSSEKKSKKKDSSEKQLKKK